MAEKYWLQIRGTTLLNSNRNVSKLDFQVSNESHWDQNLHDGARHGGEGGVEFTRSSWLDFTTDWRWRERGRAAPKVTSVSLT